MRFYLSNNIYNKKVLCSYVHIFLSNNISTTLNFIFNLTIFILYFDFLIEESKLSSKLKKNKKFLISLINQFNILWRNHQRCVIISPVCLLRHSISNNIIWKNQWNIFWYLVTEPRNYILYISLYRGFVSVFCLSNFS